jgi:ABC-2 type transport system permease protein
MRNILHVALNDLRLHLKDRSNIFFLFLMPIAFILFFGAAFRSPEGPEKVTVTLPVINADGEFLTEGFVDALRSHSFEVTEFTPKAAADTTLDASVASFPEGFTRSILSHNKTEVTLTKLAKSNESYDFAAEARLHQALVGFLGTLARWLPAPAAGAPHAPVQVSDADKGRFFALLHEEPLVRIRSSYAGRGRPVPSGMGQSVPGMLAMFIVMTVIIGGAEALTTEKATGTLTRLATTPISRREIMTGKVMGLTLLGMTQALILIVAAQVMGQAHVMGIKFSWGSAVPGLLILLVPYSVCIACIALFAGGIFRTSQQAESVSWLIGMIMAALGGCWWPLEIVPSWLRSLGHVFPTAWAMDGMHALITFGQGIGALALPVLVLSGMALVFGVLGTRTMRVTG